MPTNSDSATTTELARFALGEMAFPAEVRAAGVRGFVNILGCAFGGLGHPARETAYAVASEFAGAPTTTLIGQGRKVDALNGAYLNCLAASAHAFDDTHLATVIHPAGPVASALWALAERSAMSGQAFLDAFVLGIEIECRLGVALLVPPAEGQLGWYATGVTGGIATAAACARVLGLDLERTGWALGVAANQASGFRQTHGSMCTSFAPAHAARCGLESALLAAAGFTASDSALEGANGYFDVYAHRAHPGAATAALGERWEILDNAFKPYPCGIVIHPVLDACLTLAEDGDFGPADIAAVRVAVNPLCLMLCDRPRPEDSQRAQVSVQHWAAAALARGRAGLLEGSDACVHDPDVATLRAKVAATPDDTIGREGARVEIELAGGRVKECTVTHGVGSREKPMSDADLSKKFLDQATPVLGEAAARSLLDRVWQVTAIGDMAELLGQCARVWSCSEVP